MNTMEWHKFTWEWADVLRYLVFGQGITVFTLSAAIIIRYAMIMTRTTGSTARALPIHILLISLSYNQAIIWIMWIIYERLGRGLSYRTPWAFEIFALGDFALVFMLSHLVIQWRQIQRLKVTIDTILAEKEAAPDEKSR